MRIERCYMSVRKLLRGRRVGLLQWRHVELDGHVKL